MQTKQLTLTYSEYDSLQELPAADRALMQRAIEATDTAYAPYSHFHVGAAVRLSDGTVVIGSNQENIAYPSGLCAERTALFSAAAQHPDQSVAAMAVVGRDAEGRLVEASPCGACRQVMAECESRHGRPIELFCYLQGGKIRRITGADSLLPFAFGAELG